VRTGDAAFSRITHRVCVNPEEVVVPLQDVSQEMELIALKLPAITDKCGSHLTYETSSSAEDLRSSRSR